MRTIRKAGASAGGTLSAVGERSVPVETVSAVNGGGGGSVRRAPLCKA